VLPQASYLTAQHAAHYRLIVDVLLEQQQHSLTGIARADLDSLLARKLVDATGDASLMSDGFDLDDRMKSLTAWSVVDTWQDRAVRDEDFLRNP
jgi:hypothetical protein